MTCPPAVPRLPRPAVAALVIAIGASLAAALSSARAGPADQLPPGAPAGAAAAYRLVDTWSGQPWRLTPGRFGQTADISSGPDGRSYILDRRHRVVHRLDPEGRPEGLFRVPVTSGRAGDWTALKLDVGADGTVHLLYQGPLQGAGVHPYRVERLAPDGQALSHFDLPAPADWVRLYQDIAAGPDGRVYLSRGGPESPFFSWPGPTPTPGPLPAPADGVEVYDAAGRLQATVETSCMPDSLDLGPDGRLYVANRCPAPVGGRPPINPSPEPSRRGDPRGGAAAQDAAMPEREGVLVFGPDHDFQELVPFTNPEDIAAGYGGAFLARNADIFALGDPRPVYSGPTAGQYAAYLGKVIFHLDLRADGRLQAAMNHCYFQGLVQIDDPAARPSGARFVGALDAPELEGPVHPLRLAAGEGLALLQGRFSIQGRRPGQDYVVLPFSAEAQTVQRWALWGPAVGGGPDDPGGSSDPAPGPEGPLRSQLGLCGEAEADMALDLAMDGRRVYTLDRESLSSRPDDGLPDWSSWPASQGGPEGAVQLAAVAAAEGRVALLDAGRGRVLLLDATGRPLGDWPIGPEAPVDLALAGDRVYLADRAAARILVRGLDGRDLGAWPVHDRPERIAAGPDGTLFVLGAAGWGMRYGPAGELGALWPMPEPGPAALDIAADASGRVYVSFAERQALPTSGRRGLPEYLLARAGVWVFAEAPAPAQPAIAPGACRALADKRAAPAQLAPDEPVTVSLRVAGDCPAEPAELQLMIVLDASRSMGFEQALERARAGLAELLGGLDPARSEIGLVTFAGEARLEWPLGRDPGGLRARMAALAPEGDTRLEAAIDLAQRELAGPRGRPALRQVILVVSDGVFKDDPFLAAERVRAAGLGLRALLFTTTEFNEVHRANLRQLTAGERDLLVDPRPGTLAALADALAERRPPAELFRSIRVEDRIPTNMRFVPGSALPPAVYEPDRHALVWELTGVAPGAGLDLAYRLLPQACGDLPTNLEAWADYEDGLGRRGRLEFPVPRVAVACPAAPLYLPLLQASHCLRPRRGLDLVLVLDSSTSMGEPAGPGAGSKRAAARAAVVELLGALDPAQDRAALVAFHQRAWIAGALGTEGSAIEAALDGIVLEGGTRIDLGLVEAASALAADPRPGAARLVLLLTDGRQDLDRAPVPVLRASAAALAEAGVELHAVGLGEAVDAELLRGLVARPDRYHPAPAAGDLAGVFAAILRGLGCGAGEPGPQAPGERGP